MRSSFLCSLLAVGAYAALAALRFWPVTPWDPHTLPVCNCADYAKMTAFLEWTPWAIGHAHNPFFTSYQDYPFGVNLATNTTMPVLGIMFAPISLTVGPVVAMNLLARLAFVSAATSAFFVLRRWVTWTPAAFLGGLLFGFSPYMSAHSNGHPNLIFIALLPVLLLLLDEILVRQRWSARTTGLTLGIVAAIQYGVSSELLADAVVLSAVGVPVLALWKRELVRNRAGYIHRALAWSLLPFLGLAGYPIWMVLAGPGHLTGPIMSLTAIAKYRSDLLGAILPTRVELISLGSLGAHGSLFAINLAENATYVGAPLLAFLVWATIKFRRDERLVFASVAAVACYLVTLGSTLNINGHPTGLPLPYRILAHVPELDGALAIRFFVFGYLFIALALALGLDHLSRRWSTNGSDVPPGFVTRPAGSPSRRGQFAAPALAGLLGVAVLVPLIPRTLLPLGDQWPHPHPAVPSYAVPAFFSSARALNRIPQGSPVLIYPYSTYGTVSYSILWQAVAAFRFKLTSGDVTYPGPNRAGVVEGPALKPPQLENLFLDAFDGRASRDATSSLSTGPSPVQVRHALARYHFSTVIAAPVGADPGAVIAAITSALNRPPAQCDGVFVWYGVQRDLRELRTALANRAGRDQAPLTAVTPVSPVRPCRRVTWLDGAIRPPPPLRLGGASARPCPPVRLAGCLRDVSFNHQPELPAR